MVVVDLESDVPFGDERQAAEATMLIGTARDRPSVAKTPDHAAVADATWLTLMRDNGGAFPRVMSRGGQLVRPVPGELQELNATSLRDRMSRVMHFENGDGDLVQAPMEIAKTLLSRTEPDWWGVPVVDQVTQVPILGRSGALIVEPGYHAVDRVLYRPAEGLERVAELIGDHAEIDDVIDARRLLLDEVLGDFLFADDASRANALGLLLLPFVREFIGDNPTPMHTIAAQEHGTGKSTLADACLRPAVGELGVAPELGGGPEDRKRITSLLLKATPAVVFDNLHDVVTSGELAAALTSRVWNDRRLGVSEELSLRVRTIWASTANTPQMTPEHARRTQLVSLRMQPAGYRFRHENLSAWIDENRAEIVAAALTLVQHWAAGTARLRPDGSFEFDERARRGGRASLRSYEKWARVIGGILEAADVTGFLENREQIVAELDAETEDDAAFVGALRERFGDAEFTAREVADALILDLADAQPEEIEAARKPSLAVGNWLKHRADRVYDGLTVKKLPRSGAKNGRNVVRWRVDEVSL